MFYLAKGRPAPGHLVPSGRAVDGFLFLGFGTGVSVWCGADGGAHGGSFPRGGVEGSGDIVWLQGGAGNVCCREVGAGGVTNSGYVADCFVSLVLCLVGRFRVVGPW